MFQPKTKRNIQRLILMSLTLSAVTAKNLESYQQQLDRESDDYIQDYINCYFSNPFNLQECDSWYFNSIGKSQCRERDYECAYHQCIMSKSLSSHQECSSEYYSKLSQAYCEDYDLVCQSRKCQIESTTELENQCQELVKNIKESKRTDFHFCFLNSCSFFYSSVRGSFVCDYIGEKTNLDECKEKNYDCIKQKVEDFSDTDYYKEMLDYINKKCESIGN